jgi:hypothetical protein
MVSVRSKVSRSASESSMCILYPSATVIKGLGGFAGAGMFRVVLKSNLNMQSE